MVEGAHKICKRPNIPYIFLNCGDMAKSSSGYSKTGRFISYRLFNKELMGITQRFLHVGRNDERGEIAIVKKTTLVMKKKK